MLDNYKEIAGQNVGAALIVTGTLVLTPEAKQPLEVKAATITVEGTSTPDYPLQKKRHSVEYLRTIAHLRPRTNLFLSLIHIKAFSSSVVPLLLPLRSPRCPRYGDGAVRHGCCSRR